ncbi:MAG: hypothetical protein B1H11_12830 [Desulfobacteraceae bacterium 4484_190.1]|nr:MAG: hypothetical protein B1H11_12830 [Desulfobacteraceae bacterium 4484_190.1]
MGIIFDKNIAGFYESWRRSYQGQTIERSIEKQILTFLDPRPGERVLDIGCGTGNHMIIFNKLGLNVSGIDASPYMLDKAGERLGKRCTLKKGMAEALPFDDNEFDLTVLINTLEFLDDPLEALREAGRVTNRKIFIGVLNGFSWNGLLKRIKGYFGDPLFNHVKFYNLWHIKSLFRDAYGDTPVSWGCINIYPSFIEGRGPVSKIFTECRYSPFCCFLCISVTMTYQIRTKNLPLKISVKTASQSLAGARTAEDL